MKKFILAAIVLTILLAHPASAKNTLALGDIHNKYASSIIEWRDLMYQDDANFLLQEINDRKYIIDQTQSEIQAIVDMKMQPIAESVSDTQKRGRFLGSADERSHSESKEQYAGIYDNLNSTYNRKTKQRVLKILSQIPLNGTLSPGEAGFKTAREVLEEDNETALHLIELEGANKRLIAMQGEAANLRSGIIFYYRKAIPREAPGIRTPGVLISFAVMYFVVKRQRKKQ